MRRRITSRIFLSILLLWQLSAGMVTHAHGISGHEERSDSLSTPSSVLEMHDASMDRESIHQPSMAHSHCHEQVDAATNDSDMRAMDMENMDEMGMSMGETMDMSGSSMTMPVDASVHAQQTTHQPDCCQSLLCKCPCAHGIAMYFSLPRVPALKPRLLAIIASATPVLNAGLSGQFRPPI